MSHLQRALEFLDCVEAHLRAAEDVPEAPPEELRMMRSHLFVVEAVLTFHANLYVPPADDPVIGLTPSYVRQPPESPTPEGKESRNPVNTTGTQTATSGGVTDTFHHPCWTCGQAIEVVGGQQQAHECATYETDSERICAAYWAGYDRARKDQP